MDQQKFTAKEFAEECSKRGYVSWRDGGKKGALKWCKEHPKDFYTESDMLDVYRYFNKRRIGDTAPTQSYEYGWTKDPM